MDDPLQRLIVAWSESPQRRKKLTARQLLRLSKGPLRKALNATRTGSGPTRPNVLGMFLNANKDMLCRGYYIRSDYDAHFKHFIYFLEKVSDDELRRLTFETALAQDKRQEANRVRRHRKLTAPKQKFVYLSPPNADWWTHERTAQHLVDNLCAAHFDASLDYGPGSGELCAIRIQRSTVDEIKEYCRTHRMEFHRVRDIPLLPLKSKPVESEQVWNQNTQRWVDRVDNGLEYVRETKFIRRALGLDRQGSGAIKLKPLSRWSPFDV